MPEAIKLRPSYTFTQDKLDALKAIVPEAFADGTINWDVLRETLGEHLEPEDAPAEHFGLSWPGKRAARRLAAQPSTGTLIPAPGQGVNEGATHHLYLEGDNLEVLKLLQKSYAGRVKLIYIDPPYNTGNDFIYNDNFTEPLEDYLRKTGQTDEAGALLTSNPKASGRFHSNWLNMIYPRLLLARPLLREDGVIFVSIDDNEVHHLRQVMDEVFGAENFIGTIVWKGATDNNPTRIAIEHEYFICFAFEKTCVASVWKDDSADAKIAVLNEYHRLSTKYASNLELIQSGLRRFIKANKESLQSITHYDRVDSKGVYTGSRKVHNPKAGGYKYDVIHPSTGKTCIPPANGYRYPKEAMLSLIAEDKILFGDNEEQIIQIKEYLEDYEAKLSSVVQLDSRTAANELNLLFSDDAERVFSTPKPVTLLSDIFGFSTRNDDIILDFFSGSATTAQAVLEQNREDGGQRRFILVQLPEPTGNPTYPTIAEIGKERIRRVITKMQTGEAHQSTQPSLPHSEPGPQPSEDLGFNVLTLRRSHFRAWQAYTGDDVTQLEMLFAHAETPLTEGWQAEDVLSEVLLIEGFPLDSIVRSLAEFNHNTVREVSSEACAHKLLVCLDAQISAETLQVLRVNRDDVFICLDSALTDEAKLRLQDRVVLKVI